MKLIFKKVKKVEKNSTVKKSDLKFNKKIEVLNFDKNGGFWTGVSLFRSDSFFDKNPLISTV